MEQIIKNLTAALDNQVRVIAQLYYGDNWRQRVELKDRIMEVVTTGLIALKYAYERKAITEKQEVDNVTSPCCATCKSYCIIDPHGKRKMTSYCEKTSSLFEMDATKISCVDYSKRQ